MYFELHVPSIQDDLKFCMLLRLLIKDISMLVLLKIWAYCTIEVVFDIFSGSIEMIILKLYILKWYYF